MKHLIPAALAVLALMAGPSLAQEGETLSGPAEMIDADILAIGRQRVILWGIDAPERSQICRSGTGRYACYEAAARELATILSGGETTCTLTGERDPFGRAHGECRVGGLSINSEMVRRGFALAYLEQSDQYVPEEQEAKAAGVGLWQEGVDFEPPWEWRRVKTPGGFR